MNSQTMSQQLLAAFADAHDRFATAQRERSNFRDIIVMLHQQGAKPEPVRQGSPASPLLWNIFAEHYIDRVYARSTAPGMLPRYADDLLVTCRSVAESGDARVNLETVSCSSGTPLKASSIQVADLACGDAMTWLGYQVELRGGALQVNVAGSAWNKLHDRLQEAHLRPAAPLAAHQIVRGWLNYFGPC